MWNHERRNDGKGTGDKYYSKYTCWCGESGTTMPTDQTRPTSLGDRAFSDRHRMHSIFQSFLHSFLILFPLNFASLSPRIRCRDLGFTVVLKIASTLSAHNLQTYTQVLKQPQKLYKRYKSVQRARRCAHPFLNLVPLGFGVLSIYMYPMTWIKGYF